MSVTASELLGGVRVRSLLGMELEDGATLAQGVTGPLDENVVYVWIDMPTPNLVVLQVRARDRPVARRQIQVGALSPDVAARLVVIAASELVRAETRPRPPHKPAQPRKPSAEQLERAARNAPAVALRSAARGAYLPSSDGFLAGPSLGGSFRFLQVEERIFASWLAGAALAKPARWLEAGLGLEYHVWLGPKARIALGAEVAASSVRLGELPSRDRSDWSARAVATGALQLGIGKTAWFGLALEPGAVLHATRHGSGPDPASVEGPWFGISLALHLERLGP